MLYLNVTCSPMSDMAVLCMKIPGLRSLVPINNIQMKVMEHWHNDTDGGKPEL